jgi:hypothetical protein
LTVAGFAQSTYTYSFTAADGSPWPGNWLGASAPVEYHHGSGWGFDDPSSPSDDFTGATIGGNFATNYVGVKYDSTASFNAKNDLVYTMGWTPNGGKGFVDNGSVPSSGPANQIFQIGLFNGAPSNSWFGTNLSSTAGSDSFYLAGTETSANLASQTGSLNLGYFDENGTQLADFGTMNYMARRDVNIAGSDYQFGHLFNIRQDIIFVNSGEFSVSLTVDEYEIDYYLNGTATLVGQTSFGTQTITHGLDDITALTPGLGIAVHDASTVSISAASFDGGVPVTIPEPSVAMLSLIALSAALCTTTIILTP